MCVLMVVGATFRCSAICSLDCPAWIRLSTCHSRREFGYGVDPQADGERSRDLKKLTLAQQWSAGRSFWARPQIRVFATYAQWDGGRYQAASESIDAGDDDGLTFGVQAEAWW